MRRGIPLLKQPKGVNLWTEVHIFPSQLGPGGANRIGKRVEFNYYDFGPFCQNRTLNFKSEKEAKEFVRWFRNCKK